MTNPPAFYGIDDNLVREIGSGVYSVGWDCESASSAVRDLLAELREKGMVEEVWQHTEGEFKRITERDGGL